ncbi:MAG: protease modulator HflC [Alphaproteobacteria bacterium]|nr:protease modulator HflC [Alphaproteobacteria bacterium]MBU1515506.1 protease modulator HflC [Alphaproteobacteria bacterium]MBU2095504.1 protease modulator HflC [Alphaproteobacteria bacterium]MBU2150745.1 protease modulator HflC [Alphaproteobacteria bacterium]MBU2307010.1 protease modulator HflC [Alphaproteobacteria bacterium]
MNTRSLVLGLLGLFVVVLVFQTFYIVDQREQAIVVQFGDPVRVVNPPGKSQAGLNLKVPFIEQVIKLDRRNIALEADQEEIITAGQERLVVDAFIRYRITDPLQFYRTLRDEQTAKDRIERLVNSSLRQVLGSASATDIISGRRAQLMQQAKVDVEQRAKASRLGIQVIDLRIRRADLPTQNREAVFRRMSTSRQQVAAQLRAEGEQKKREIIAQADKEVAITLATAREQSGQITGEGDAVRTRIFAQSFGKDPSFAAFFRSMQAYEASLANGDTTLVLSPDSAFFRYFERGPTGK